jgi:hypothetical protein
MTEPDPDLYLAAKSALAAGGHSTIAFGRTPALALRLARFVRPDLAILDVGDRPPLRLARTLVRGLLCPVLFLAPGEPALTRQMLGFPALALAKPYDPAARVGAALLAMDFFWSHRLADPLPAGLRMF